MSAVDLGGTAELHWTAVPAGGTPAVTVTRPDGTPQSASAPVLVSGTEYKASFTPTMAGRHLVKWTSSVVVDAYTDVLDVWPADPLFIIPLGSALSALNARGRMAAEDAEDLRLYVAAATPVIEDIVGPVVYRQFTQVADGGKWAIPLNHRATEVLSVSEIDSVITEFVYDDEAGILYAGRRYALRKFMPGVKSVTITYKAGYQVIPANIQLAARELVRHWWQLGKQAAGGRSTGMTADETFTPSGFAVPRRVVELCTPHETVGGFA